MRERNNSKADGDNYTNPDFYLLIGPHFYYYFPLTRDLITQFEAQKFPLGAPIGAWDHKKDGHGNMYITKAEVQALLSQFSYTRIPDVAAGALRSEGFHSTSYYVKFHENEIKTVLNPTNYNQIKTAIRAVLALRNPGMFARAKQAWNDWWETDSNTQEQASHAK